MGPATPKEMLRGAVVAMCTRGFRPAACLEVGVAAVQMENASLWVALQLIAALGRHIILQHVLEGSGVAAFQMDHAWQSMVVL